MRNYWENWLILHQLTINLPGKISQILLYFNEISWNRFLNLLKLYCHIVFGENRRIQNIGIKRYQISGHVGLMVKVTNQAGGINKKIQYYSVNSLDFSSTFTCHTI